MSISQKFPRLAFTILLAGATAVCAESLEQITSEALRSNPELKLLEQGIASAKGGVLTARTFDNPELTIAPGARQVEEGGRKATFFHGEVSISQLFKFPGKRALEIAIAERNVELAELAREAFRFQVTTNVRRAFYDFLAARQIAQVRREQVQSAENFVEVARRRAEAGYASDFDIIKSQADLIGAHKSLSEVETRMSLARVTLNSLMGRNPKAPLTILGELRNLQPRGTPSDFLALAMARNPGIRTSEQQLEIAGLSLRSTRVAGKPDLAVGPSIEWLDNEQTYGLSVTLPLPLWDQKKGAIQTATAGQKKALAEFEKTRLEVATEVAKASATLERATQQLRLYSRGFLDRMKAVMAQAEQGYAQNTTTLLIYLDAKRTYFDTLADYYQTLGEVAENRAELESAVGVPLELKPNRK